jgi:hypothetical protein
MPERLIAATFVLLFINLIFWGVWYADIVTITSLASRPVVRRPLYLAPLACWVGLLLVTFAAGVPYWWLVAMGGALAVGILMLALPWLGVDPREDVAERRNEAATWVICGAIAGLTLAFAVPLVERPGEAIAFVRSILAAVALLGVWYVLELVAAPNEAVTVDRDVAAGRRLAGFLVAAGLLLGHLAADSFTDLGRLGIKAAAVPVLLLLAILVRKGQAEYLFVGGAALVVLLVW